MQQDLKRITYVEDEADIRAVVSLTLSAIGNFTIDVCTSGAEALIKAPEFHPDLILLDVMMPGLDGVETFHALQKIAEVASIPVVFMTAKAQKSEIDAYKEMGAVDVIPKPFDPMTLSNEVNEIWQRYLTEKAA